jgi:phospholipase C
MNKIKKAMRLAAVSGLAGILALSVPIRSSAHDGDDDDSHYYGATKTPIEHVVVIFQENVSFDHYFGTYPHAAPNLAGPVLFGKPKDDTPRVNGLEAGGLMTNNPNFKNTANAPHNINPFRLDRSQASTCDQGHNYGPEQQAADQGLMDLFPKTVGQTEGAFCNAGFAWGKDVGLVMGYFDGNTVTGLWNYAQHFAMSDNSFSSTFGPSTPGLLNLVAGNTYPATSSAPQVKIVPNTTPATATMGTLVGDLDPTGDLCSAGTTVQLGGKNIGDLLNAKGVTWGSFMGGFDLTITNAFPGSGTGCARVSPASPANIPSTQADYIPHHSFFNYYASTANFAHTRPASMSEIGNAGPANHQYDIDDFFTALKHDNFPAVSFLKAIAVQDGHAGYSDPLMEQTFLVNTINAIMESRFWQNTAIIVLYDDSDGWYDHQMPPIVNPSAETTGTTSTTDQLNTSGVCGHGAPLSGASGPIQGRCGYGPRQPLLVISPFAKENFVDSTLTDQSSVLRFIEDNWQTGQIGGGSFDAIAGSLWNMFDFDDRVRAEDRELLLNSDGTIKPDHDHGHDHDYDGHRR